MDTSFYQKAGSATPLDVASAAQKGLSLRKLMTEVQFQPQLLEQELASARASQAATEEGTRKAQQEREEQARKIEASRGVSGIYKDLLTQKDDTGKLKYKPNDANLHREVYETALQRGFAVDVLSDLRDRAQTIRQADLVDMETRQEAKQKLIRQLDMEMAQATNDQIPGLAKTKIAELTKLGVEDPMAFLSERYGTDPSQIGTQAQSRLGAGALLRAELTPLKAADLAIAQAQDRRAANQQLVDVGAGTAGGQGAIADIDQALRGLNKLRGTYGTRAGSWISANYDQYVSQNAEGGALARAIGAYNARNPAAPLDVKAQGYEPVRAALEGERQKLSKQVQATAPVLGPTATNVPPAPRADNAATPTQTYKVGDIVEFRGRKIPVYTDVQGSRLPAGTYFFNPAGKLMQVPEKK